MTEGKKHHPSVLGKYHAPSEELARAALDRVDEKWTPKYPNSMK